MQKLLLQLDTSPHPSVFDRIVAFDAGADQVMSYGGITEDVVRELVHGAIFTRKPKELRNTAIFIGGTEMVLGERVLRAVTDAFFGPMRVSVMLDSNGSNTTAVAAVAKMQQAVGDVRGLRAVVTAGTGPVGLRAAGLLARAGAHVVVTSRRLVDAAVLEDLRQRFNGSISALRLEEPSQADAALQGAALLLNSGPAGVTLVPRSAWMGRAGLRMAVDLNAVPPPGIEGIGLNDDGVAHEGVTAYGPLAVGSLKMKLHKACLTRLFERNDAVLDVETIADIVREAGAA